MYVLSSNNTVYNITDGLQTFVNILLGLDIASRCLSLASHLVYFIIILSIKELRAISLIYMHQVNFYGLLFILHFCAYIGTNNPVFENQTLDVVLCTMSEIAWSALKYLRSYSVLLLAIFRMVAVVNSHLFRKWVKSPKWIVSCMMAQILLCVLLTVLSKLVIQTTYGDVLCDDGYNVNFYVGLYYFLLTSIFGMFFPCMLVTMFYIYTKYAMSLYPVYHNRSTRNSVRLANSSLSIFFHSSLSTIKMNGQTQNPQNISLRFPKKNLSGKAQLARQFLIINFCLLLSLFAFILLNLANLIEEFNSEWFHFRLIIRIISILSGEIVPIVFLNGNPSVRDQLKFKFLSRKVKHINN